MPTVIIGCKLPAGLVLEIVDPGTDDAGKIGIMPRPVGKRVTLKGANSIPRLRSAIGEVPNLSRYPYALTTVDKDFWDTWYERNKAIDVVKGGMVFVAKDEASAKAIAKERRDVKTGLEPLSPKMNPTDDTRPHADPAMKKLMAQNEQEIPDAA